MELTPLNVLYGVLAVAVLVIGGLLAVVLWQLSLAIAQARTALLPQVMLLMKEAERNLTTVDSITGDVNRKLVKLDEAVDAANTAVKAIGKTTLLVNQTVAQPAVIRAASMFAGARAAWGYMRERGFKSRHERELEAQEEAMVREPAGALR